ncbi:hypothetical protein RHS01_09492 [Rhizoctonia solani]|uniref:Uncharacterized protein n=1 Tax=Rhizoctonia solani TaxID=456999 RepID=A0A8H7I5I1_9AGAM|nr:hypothetical protein RHS01_09492 [Rhizoctonia solani]
MSMVQAFMSAHRLKEQLPSTTQRYDDQEPGSSSPMVIRSTFLNEQSTVEVELPDGWQRFCNPAEGRPYYRNPLLRILTESNITEGHVLNRVMQWNQIIAPLASRFTKRDYDVVLNVSGDEGMGSCNYYLVDYAAKEISWLRDLPTTTLGMPDIRSSNHLNTLSSTGSVSPFQQEECELYSRALLQALNNGGHIEINWCLGRLHSLITQSRIINLFGEPNARTDRNVVVNGQKSPPETMVFMLWSILMFNIPSIYLARWNAIWVDRVTYTREWRKLTKDVMEELLYGLIASGVMILASVTLQGLTSSTAIRVLATVAMIFAITSGFYAASLFSKLRTLGGCAADAANYIQINEHINTGLQTMALEHSIPWALIVWSGAFLFVSGLWEIMKNIIVILYPAFQGISRSLGYMLYVELDRTEAWYILSLALNFLICLQIHQRARIEYAIQKAKK